MIELDLFLAARFAGPLTVLAGAALLGVALAAGDGTSGPPKPPVAKRVPHVTEIHGRKVEDPYFWLRERDNPDVRAYLEAENAYSERLLAHTEALRKKLYDEMLGRIKQTDTEVPYRKGGWLYTSRTEEGKQYRIYGRRRPAEGAPEEVLLDVNQLAAGKKFMSLGDSEIDDAGTKLAYTTDDVGFRQYTLWVKDLAAGTTTHALAERVTSVAWAADGATLFYTVEHAQTKRSYQLYRLAPGGAPQLVFEEPDEHFDLSVHRTRSGKYLVLTIGSHTTTEQRVLRADQPQGAWTVVEPRRANVEYSLDHQGDRFLIVVNDTGRNFRLVEAPENAPGKAQWRELIAARNDVMLEHVQAFAGFHVVVARVDGRMQFLVTDRKTGATHPITFAEPAYSAGPSVNEEYDTTLYRYGYQSAITPRSVYDWDVTAKKATLLKRDEVPSGHDPSRYVVERVFATAHDGTKIPISLMYRKGVKKDGKAPLFLYGYGSYGIPIDPSFSGASLSLADRGVITAIAHIRGGGEYGKTWHDGGRMATKMNTFTDFIAAAEYLVAEKYTEKGRIAAEGGSAGGLLMGAVTNLRPDLFRCIVSLVPFVDVLNTMLDETLPLTVGEYEEWGNPHIAAEYDRMAKYSPYDNLGKQAYPAILVRTSLDDSQVMYWEPAKYVAKLRTLKTDKHVLLLHVNLAGGHGGSSGRYDHLKEVAMDLAFVLDQFGIAN